MKKQDIPESPAATPAQAQPDSVRAIILQNDWGQFLAGRVLRADLDLLAVLDKDGARYRNASERERHLAGID